MFTQQDKDLILVVEDDRDISEMLCAYLRTKQFRVVATPMGLDVLGICQEENPSLVLLDINLPDIDGYEVCRRLRANLFTSNLPILFLTQNKLRKDKLSGLKCGADDYITKPFDMRELYLRVSNALRQYRYRTGIGQVSRLPEGPLIESQLKALLTRGDWAVVLIRIENFGQFARAYKHLKDKFVHYVGQLIRQSVDEIGNFEDFVGHVGSVDFIVITTPPRVDRLCQRTGKVFARVMNPSGENGKRKPITAQLDLSFSVLTDQDGPFGDVRSLAEAVTRSPKKISGAMGDDGQSQDHSTSLES